MNNIKGINKGLGFLFLGVLQSFSVAAYAGGIGSGGGHSLNPELDVARRNAIDIVNSVVSLNDVESDSELLTMYLNSRDLIRTKLYAMDISIDNKPKFAMRDGVIRPVESNVFYATDSVVVDQNMTKDYPPSRLEDLVLFESVHLAGYTDEDYKKITKLVGAIRKKYESRAGRTRLLNDFDSFLDRVEISSVEEANRNLDRSRDLHAFSADRVEKAIRANTDAHGILKLDLGPTIRAETYQAYSQGGVLGSQSSHSVDTIYEDNSSFQQAYLIDVAATLGDLGYAVVSVGVKDQVAEQNGSMLVSNPIMTSGAIQYHLGLNIASYAFIAPDKDGPVRIQQEVFQTMKSTEAIRQMARVYKAYLAAISERALQEMGSQRAEELNFAAYARLVEEATNKSQLEFKITAFPDKKTFEDSFSGSKEKLDQLLYNITHVGQR